MSDQTTTAIKCVRCGTEVESCAFCDEPDCPSVTCYRCMNIALVDRQRFKTTDSSPTRS
jgi:hypothetical protein